MEQLSPRLQDGKFFLEILWYKVAEKIVEKAIDIYSLDEEQASALREVFLKPNLYVVNLT